MSGAVGLLLRGTFIQGQHNHLKAKYEQLAAPERLLAPSARFVKRGAFFPADQIKAIAQSDSGFQFVFGFSKTNVAATAKTPDLSKWHAAAAKKRSSLENGLPNPTLVSLDEWILRVSDTTPQWVTELIQKLSTELTSAPLPALNHPIELVQRLVTLGTPEALAIGEMIATRQGNQRIAWRFKFPIAMFTLSVLTGYFCDSRLGLVPMCLLAVVTFFAFMFGVASLVYELKIWRARSTMRGLLRDVKRLRQRGAN